MCFSVKIPMDMQQVSRRLEAQISSKAFNALSARMQLDPKKYKMTGIDHRIFPNYYAPVIIHKDQRRVMGPMRYRLHPSWSPEEIPTKFNLFNARLDALEKRKSWKNIFMRNHALFPFVSFYEWVENPQGKKALINFTPEGVDLMWAPCLYDRWVSPEGDELVSFAIITTDPPAEVAQMGHDRCPIFLQEHLIDHWLSPQKFSKMEIYKMLQVSAPVTFLSQWAA